MSWLYVPGLEGSSLASALPRPMHAACVTWRGKHRLPRLWSRAWQKGGYIRHLSGLTLRPSTLDRGVASFIASLPATPANPTASPGDVRASAMTDGSPSASSVSSRPFGRIVSSARTSQGMQADSLALSFHHWRRWAIGLRREYSARPKSVPVIDASDSSSWPTANTRDSESTARHTTSTGVMHPGTTLTDAIRQWQTPATDSFRSRGGDRKDEQGLDQQARTWPTPRSISGGPESGERKQQLGRTESGGGDLQAAAETWATPQARDHETPHSKSYVAALKAQGHGMRNLNDEAVHWPTPISRDHKSIYANQVTMEKNSRPLSEAVSRWRTPNTVDANGGTRLGEGQEQLTFQASRFSRQGPETLDGPLSSSERRTLNPRFVEWLMGWPIGWTSFVPVAMASSRWLRRMHGALSTLLSAPSGDPEQIDLEELLA